jgi:BirA family biotin operon repressor/biotin-[acetyl-CoA-carboxylase] ligase
MKSVFLDEVDSTNEEAKRRAFLGELGPIWIGAACQTVGRGRRGRSWTSERGNLFATGLYSLKNGKDAANLSFVTAIAVAKVLETWVENDKIALKWPNDVLIDGKKVCGILIESWVNDGLFQLAIGVGTNIIHAPIDTERPATYIAAHLKPTAISPSPQEALTRLAAAFQDNLEILNTFGFSEIRKLWLNKAQGIGKTIVARTHNSEICGTFEFLGENGELCLRDNNNILHQITAGDVFLL